MTGTRTTTLETGIKNRFKKDINSVSAQPFENEKQKLRSNLLYTSSWLKEEIKDFLEAYNITFQQYNILKILKSESSQSLGTQHIRNKMLDKMSDTSRLIDRLEKKELVAKTPCAFDKRLVDNTITEKGLQLIEEVEQNIVKLDRIFHGLTDGEIRILNSLLDKARNKPLF